MDAEAESKRESGAFSGILLALSCIVCLGAGIGIGWGANSSKHGKSGAVSMATCGNVTAKEISGPFYDTGDLNCKFLDARAAGDFSLSIYGMYSQPFKLPFKMDTTSSFAPDCAGTINFIVPGKAHPCGLTPPLGNNLYVTYFQSNRTLVFYLAASRTASDYANQWVQQDNLMVPGSSSTTTSIAPSRNVQLNCRCAAVSCVDFIPGSSQTPTTNPGILSDLCVMSPNGTVSPCTAETCLGG
eukprot:CAMPEP_0194364324 /NCGR_PEP_ID=MMETSP0174-20130528/12249_1 /TAXON_ID=216777 /ORGANISM="Proboscia alata, Strain PI-D3" /LENGTH=241 /DNA_ID=CAMNT_0039138307 /DNA_START=54 /DNA_END=779 /DNA_ORIENTATION=-